jgi:hypothetical protein
VEGETRVLFRIAKHDPPTDDDFLPSDPLPDDDEETKRLRTGVSMWATQTQARKKARAMAWLGHVIAQVALPDSAVVERTTSSRGHHTVWDDPNVLAGAVIDTSDVWE